jgi:hypothetical protein
VRRPGRKRRIADMRAVVIDDVFSLSPPTAYRVS